MAWRGTGRPGQADAHPAAPDPEPAMLVNSPPNALDVPGDAGYRFQRPTAQGEVRCGRYW